MAGCVGGMLSIAATNVHLHISVPERRWFRIRKITGANRSSVVSSDGKHADIRLNDLRFGERRDVLVEVEMAAYDGGASSYQEQRKEETQTFSTATDAFLSKVGLDPATLADYQSSSFYDDEYDGMPDEVPLFEVSFCFWIEDGRSNSLLLRSTPRIATRRLGRPSLVFANHRVYLRLLSPYRIPWETVLPCSLRPPEPLRLFDDGLSCCALT